jgi:UDP-3-O-[3-hydroxymyristoyl] glucosamine N-acyltransferase
LISEDPFRDFNKLTNYFKPFQFSNVSIATSASIGGTVIQPNTFIGNHVIGKNCLIHSNAIYDHTIIGDNDHSCWNNFRCRCLYYKKTEGYDQLLLVEELLSKIMWNRSPC